MSCKRLLLCTCRIKDESEGPALPSKQQSNSFFVIRKINCSLKVCHFIPSVKTVISQWMLLEKTFYAGTLKQTFLLVIVATMYLGKLLFLIVSPIPISSPWLKLLSVGTQFYHSFKMQIVSLSIGSLSPLYFLHCSYYYLRFIHLFI